MVDKLLDFLIPFAQSLLALLTHHVVWCESAYSTEDVGSGMCMVSFQ